MNLTERRQHQTRFAETYVELASQLLVSEDDLLVGVRSHVSAEAMKQSGYPVEWNWMLGERANGVLRNPYVQAEIKRLAQARLATSSSPVERWTMTHLVRCGRLTLPDYEIIAERIAVPIEELEQLHMDKKLADFYVWKMRELALARELGMTVAGFEQFAAEQGKTPQKLYEDKIEEGRAALRQELSDDMTKASRLFDFVENHDLWPAFEAIMDDEQKTAALMEFIQQATSEP